MSRQKTFNRSLNPFLKYYPRGTGRKNYLALLSILSYMSFL